MEDAMKRQDIRIIAAVGSKGLMGVKKEDNTLDLAWHLPEDMRHVRETTQDGVLIMGRATWESIPERFRKFPEREILIITRDKDFDPGIEKAKVFTDPEYALEKAIAYAKENFSGQTTWIFGGIGVYQQILSNRDLSWRITGAHLTRVDEDLIPEPEGEKLRTNVFEPDALRNMEFEPDVDIPELLHAKNGIRYWFETWTRP